MILQSCPDCARQYDVRHLRPGDRVRCACEARFTVDPARDVRVRGRRCTNCGGPVAAGLESCEFCGAGLDEAQVRAMPCPRCFTWIDEDARHCASCGAQLRSAALPPIPAGARCPRCRGALLIRSLETTSFVECGDCNGVWLSPDAFHDLCEEAARRAAPATPFQRPERRKPPEAPLAYIPCLDCGELMQRRQYRHASRPTGVVLDVCRDHGLWFDPEELAAVVAAIERGGAPAAKRAEPFLPPRRSYERVPAGARGNGTFIDSLLRAVSDLFLRL